jgi:hypothetical protein
MDDFAASLGDFVAILAILSQIMLGFWGNAVINVIGSGNAATKFC